MDRFDLMSVFAEVAAAGSLSAAGRSLGVPLATVSRKLSMLEAHLETRLFNRSSRHLTLTDGGRAYLESCRKILEEVGEAERIAVGENSAPKGNLAITSPIVFGRLHVLPVVSEFLKIYPDITVRMMLVDRVIDLLEEHIDLAVRIGELPDSALVATRVGTVRRVVCASPDYLSRRGIPLRPQDLTEHDCISFDNLASPQSWRFGTKKSEISVAVRSRLVVNTAEAAIDATIAGVGITRVLSYQIASAVRSGALRIVLDSFEPAAWPVSLLHTGQMLAPLKLRAFMEFAAPHIRTKLA